MPTCNALPEPEGTARPSAPFEGRVSLTLQVADQRVVGSTVAVARPPAATVLLTGLPVEDATRLVGLVFSLCGTAQTVAALGAAEAALDRPCPVATRTTRRALVLVEALDQSAMRIGLDWADQVGVLPDADGLRTVRRTLAELREGLTSAHPGWDRIGGGDPKRAVLPPWTAEALEDIRTLIRGRIGTLPCGVDSVAALRAWITDGVAGGVTNGGTMAARTVALALDGPPDPAAGEVPTLTDWRLDDVASPLRDPDTAKVFAVRPDWRGQPAETGAMARFRTHPLVHGLISDGRGLAARLVARLLDLSRIVADLDTLAAGTAPQPIPTLQDGPGVGLAAVDTARGVLLHRIAIADGRIAAWTLVAPTDWNTHPDGVLARAPLGWPADDRDRLMRRARLLALAVDPCMAHDVTVVDDGSGGAPHA